MVAAARRHLTTGYAEGVDRLLWETEKRPLPDLAAVRAVISASQSRQRVDGPDIGAALVLLLELRLYLDCLEAEMLDLALDSGLDLGSLAAVLELPDPVAVRSRLKYLGHRRELPRAITAEPSSPLPDAGQSLSPQPAESGAARAASRAGRRAESAASRAASAVRRIQELKDGQRGISRADADLAAARASEARIAAGDAAERVASGLLRAADTLDECAAKCTQGDDAYRDPALTQRAHEYSAAARRYRDIAASYLDIGHRI
jgi:hypothetical protein